MAQSGGSMTSLLARALARAARKGCSDAVHPGRPWGTAACGRPMTRGLSSCCAGSATNTSTATTTTGACATESTASTNLAQHTTSSSCGSNAPAAPAAGAAPFPVPSPTLQQRPAAEVLAPLLRGRPFIVAKIPGRGRGIVADRPIRSGELVHVEQPLLCCPAHEAARQVCHHCLGPLAVPVTHRPSGRRFCSPACLRDATRAYLAVEGAARAAAASTTAASPPTERDVQKAGAGQGLLRDPACVIGSAAAAAAGGGGAGDMGGAEGAGPGANPLDELEEQCRLHGERFPLMAARLSYMHVTDVVRRRLAARGLLPSPPADCTRSAQGGGAGGGGGGLCSAYGTAYGSSGCSAYGCSTPSSSSPGGASEPTLADSLKALQRLQHEGVGAGAGAGAGTPGSDAGSTGAADGRGGLLPLRGDPLTSLHVLCFANVPPPYPPHWVEQHGLAAAALRRLAADPAAVGAAAAALLAAEAAAGRKQQRGALADEALVQELCAAVAGAAGALDAGWFVSVLARLHLNVFQVHNPMAGADPSDLARAAAALVSGTGGGGSSGSAAYLLASLFNHSCEPSLDLSYPFMDSTAVFTAARDIEPGDELTVSYLDVGLPYEARQQHLAWSYGFACACARCREEGAEQQQQLERQGSA